MKLIGHNYNKGGKVLMRYFFSGTHFVVTQISLFVDSVVKQWQYISLLIKYLVGKNFLCDVTVPEKQGTAKVVKLF